MAVKDKSATTAQTQAADAQHARAPNDDASTPVVDSGLGTQPDDRGNAIQGNSITNAESGSGMAFEVAATSCVEYLAKDGQIVGADVAVQTAGHQSGYAAQIRKEHTGGFAWWHDGAKVTTGMELGPLVERARKYGQGLALFVT